jgi:hypothetical protein
MSNREICEVVTERELTEYEHREICEDVQANYDRTLIKIFGIKHYLQIVRGDPARKIAALNSLSVELCQSPH